MTPYWPQRVAQIRHPLLVPSLWLMLSLSYFYIIWQLGDGSTSIWETNAGLLGSILVYCLIPAFQLACAPYCGRRTSAAAEAFAGLVADPAALRTRLLHLPVPVLAAGLSAGLVMGLAQYWELIGTLSGRDTWLLDLSMIVANTIVWVASGWMLSWRLYVATGLYRMGQSIPADLYDQRPLRPFVQVATMDLLLVMGTVALLPLQSLDAEFRWDNYEAALYVALPAGALAFLLPLWGIHQNLSARKRQRREELQDAVSACDRDDLIRLQALVDHAHAVATMSTWPVDVRILSRTLFYLIIPPLAWVGAALVENMLERFL